MTENEIGRIIVDTAIEVHRNLRPGLLESVYETSLAYEIENRRLTVERQVSLPVHYKGLHFNEGFRADLIIEKKVIIEIKSIEIIHNAHRKQLLTYLRLTGMKLGFLLNFGEPLMKNGISRTVNGL